MAASPYAAHMPGKLGLQMLMAVLMDEGTRQLNSRQIAEA